eukprot:12902010-Prorocentrum_lima.AAC.1
MANALPVSKPHPRSTGKKASSGPPPKKKEVNNQDEASYLYTGVITQEQDNVISILTAMTPRQ